MYQIKKKFEGWKEHQIKARTLLAVSKYILFEYLMYARGFLSWGMLNWS
jgi:hypothetical protein